MNVNQWLWGLPSRKRTRSLTFPTMMTAIYDYDGVGRLIMKVVGDVVRDGDGDGRSS